MTFTTTDLGLAVRDFIEGQRFEHFDEESELMQGTELIDTVDCSDASNLSVRLGNGQQFLIRIIAI